VRGSITLFTIFLLVGCAKVLAVREIPQVTVGDASFVRTIEAHTGAPIVAGNNIEVLLNGDQTFPRMLRDIKSANPQLRSLSIFTRTVL
jgi:cardiolipin synthase